MRKIKRKCLKIKTGGNVKAKEIGKELNKWRKMEEMNKERTMWKRKRNWWKKRGEEWNIERDEEMMEKGREWKS